MVKKYKFLEAVSEYPRFQDELDDIFPAGGMLRYVRTLVMEGVGIRRFAYRGCISGGRGENTISQFIIYYLEEDKFEAYERVRKRFPDTTNRWQQIGIPMLGRESLVRRGETWKIKMI